jgi:hypothetical protein
MEDIAEVLNEFGLLDDDDDVDFEEPVEEWEFDDDYFDEEDGDEEDDEA